MDTDEMRLEARERLGEYVTITQSGGSIDLEQLGEDINTLLEDWKDNHGIILTTNFDQPVFSVKFEEQGDTIVMRTNGGW